MEGCERRGAGSFELNPSLHELKHTNTRFTQKTGWTHDANLTVNVGLHVSGLFVGPVFLPDLEASQLCPMY